MLASLQHINNLIYVEIALPQLLQPGDKFYFPYVDALLAYPCVGVVSFMNENVAQSVEGQNVIDNATAQRLYVTLVDQDSVSFISQMPYYQLSASNFNQPIFKFSKARYLDLERCYVILNDRDVALTRIVFIFEYLRNV
jgi:hypothetical protein